MPRNKTKESMMTMYYNPSPNVQRIQRNPEFHQAFRKLAAALLTPEAMEAATQPPMQDPSMMQQGAPMDPSMMQQGQPPQQDMGQPPMDPGMGVGMPPQGAPQQGSQLPPEIMQDQQFIQFLQQMAGITLDQNSGMFMDPQGQPVPDEMIMQAYEAYAGAGQEQPMDPNMQQGMDPSMGQPPMDQGMDPSMQQGMDPSMEPGGEDDIAMLVEAITEAVAGRVEDSLGKVMASLEKKLSAMADKVDMIKSALEGGEQDEAGRSLDSLRKDLANEMAATSPEASPEPTPIKMASKAPKQVNLFTTIKGAR